MDEKLTLVKTILLLYRESQIPDTDLSVDLAKDVTEHIKAPDASIGFGRNRDLVSGLKNFVSQLIAGKTEVLGDKDLLCDDLAVACGEEDRIYEMLSNAIHRSIETPAIRRAISLYKNDLREALREYKTLDLMGRTYQTMRYNPEKIQDRNAFMEEFRIALDMLQAPVDRKDPAIMAEVSMTNTAEMVEIIRAGKNLMDGIGVLRLGKKLLNDMTQGGIRRPSLTTVNGMKHQNKSGFAMELFREIAFYNTPVADDPTRKPALIRMSFENEMESDLIQQYEAIRFARTGDETPDISASPEVMSAYIVKELAATGYSIFTLRVDPTQWTYQDIKRKVMEYEADGFEIHVLLLDYLRMIPTTGCDRTGAAGTDIRDLFRRMRIFGSMKKIAIITPHQVAPDANNLLRAGIPAQNFVKEIHDKNYYEGSKQIGQEPDLEFFIHIVEHNGKSYLTVQRGKHRGVRHLGHDRRYGILPFCGPMPPKDDVLLDEALYYRSLKDIPADNDSNRGLF